MTDQGKMKPNISTAKMMLVVYLAILWQLPLVMAAECEIYNLDNENRIKGEYLFVLHTVEGETSTEEYAQNVASKIVELHPRITVNESYDNLKTPILFVQDPDDEVNGLCDIPEVDFVDANVYTDYMIASTEDDEDCLFQDTYFRLWNLGRIATRANPFWQTGYYYKSDDGTGVRVYLFDTGVRTTHNDFTKGTRRASFGFNAVGGSDEDNHGHGTHCAGTIMGREYGVAKNASLVSVKVISDDRSGVTNQVIKGINWMVGNAKEHPGRSVASLSIKTDLCPALDSAVTSIDAAGIPAVVASIYNPVDACLHSPGRVEPAITVTSFHVTEKMDPHAGYGPCVDIFAPGSAILSASHRSNTATASMEGSSMACAHVAGAVAKYLGKNPTATTKQVKEYIINSGTPDIIKIDKPDTVNLLLYSGCPLV